MLLSIRLLLPCAILTASSLGCSQSERVDFNRDVRPILNEQCVTCHGGVRRQGDLNLLFRLEALQPAESGKPAIVPFDPDASELVRRIHHPDPQERMPREGNALTSKQMHTLRKWIAEGATWDVHWAYQAPTEPAIPPVSDPSWPQNRLDFLVLSRLDKESLSPSPRADCHTLLRRVSLDLTGLPPTPKDIATICNDADPNGYTTFVDSLLASPHFGERWASMWLDLARYADSKGYEKDIPRTIWRYRDWVIRAFNEDMPFDQFTIEQLAGDLLPRPTEEQRIATAFHRNTMTNTEGGTDDEEFRIAAVIDRVNTTWEVWQGTSFACVQCHGHPYDPFRHEEYYQFLAFFNNTADWDQDDERPTLPLFANDAVEIGGLLLQDIRQLEEAMHTIVTRPDVLAARRAWEGQLDNPTVVGKVPGRSQNEVRRIALTPVTRRDAAQEAFLASIYAEISDHPELIALRKTRQEKRGAINALDPVLTPIMEELPSDRLRQTVIFERGSFLLRGKAVMANVPDALPPLPPHASRNRLSMAKWLVNTDNPLTARVTVNRFWQQIFGQGIVASLEDFGTQGMPPSHPALLDHLARQFMHEHAWSMKALLRTIVTSSTYQQSSSVTPTLLERDPNNQLLARGPRFRLSAEQIRDQALQVSGLLNTQMYGPSVKPPQPEGLWQNPYDNTRWETSYANDRYRRGVYTYWRRTVPYPSMATFDSPSREFCVSRRIRTNTPLQALVTLNDPVFVEAAQALARRMDHENGITTGYILALAHPPLPAEEAALQALHDDALRHYTEVPDDIPHMTSGASSARLAATTVVANAILNLDAFLTKE